MSLKGKLIKKSIEIGEPIFNKDEPKKEQEHILLSLLDKAKDTEFGKAYNFEKILKDKDPQISFAKNLPPFDYHKMEKEWWHKTQNGVANVTWPGKPEYFALSSGTTGNSSKRIPVTSEMIKAIRETGIKQVLSLSNFNLPEEFFEKETLMLGSSTNLEEVDGHYEGEISGISASNIPFWFQGYYKPGEDIANISNWDERVLAIAKKAQDWDIGAISGIPSWIELMLKKVIDYNDLNTIHDIWPNLRIYNSGGVAFEPYRKSFNKLMGKEMLYLDTYLASEGFMAYQSRPNHEMAMQLSTNAGIYFEFIPFEEEYFKEDGSPIEDAPALDLSQVEIDKEYALLISTVSGAWRYSIGDTIKFVDVERAEIKITGRTKHFLNVVGSQLSIAKMNEAIQKLGKQFNIEIPEFVVGVVKEDDKFYHQWIIGTNKVLELESKDLAKELDQILKDKNKNYGVARTKSLAGVKLTVTQTDRF